MAKQSVTENANPSVEAKLQQHFEFIEACLPQLDPGLNSRRNKPQRPEHTVFASVKRVSLVHERSMSDRPKIGGSLEAISFFKSYWKQVVASDQERFVVACLDTKNRVQSVVLITVGTLDASLVHPREVFKPPILEGSSSIILSHNHPSGDTTPSHEDIAVTERLTQAGKLLGIDVLDHIIYGDGSEEAISIRETE